MSKKWNDPDARDNYALLITLDNTIISFIFMYVNYVPAQQPTTLPSQLQIE